MGKGLRGRGQSEALSSSGPGEMEAWTRAGVAGRRQCQDMGSVGNTGEGEDEQD